MDSVDKLTGPEAIHQLIAARAYALWESQGRPHGYDLNDWRQAEQEVMNSSEEGNGSAADQDAQAKSPRPASRAKPKTARSASTPGRSRI